MRPDYEAMADAELWRIARDGSPDGFAALYLRHAKRIYNYLFRRVGDWGAAEELVSTVFLEAYRRRSDAGPVPEKIVPWLFGIATRVANNHNRSAWRAKRLAFRLFTAAATSAQAEDAAERAAARETMQRLLRHLRLLPSGQQDVFALCVWSGLSYEDAAEALGVPVGTVRSRLARAKRALADGEAEPSPGSPTRPTVREVNS